MKILIAAALSLGLSATLTATLTGSRAAAQPADTRLSVLPGYMTSDGTRMTALRLTLPVGWKTYWRSPGDAGIPPQVSLSAAPGARLHWPTPQVFDQNGMRSVGYHGGLVLPIEVAGDTARLRGTLDIGICQDICVPVQLDFDADLGDAGARDPAIVAAFMNQPQPGGRAVCRLDSATDGLTLTATLTLPDTGGAEALVIETADPQVWVSEPQITRQGDTLVATARLTRGGQAFALDRSGVRFTVLGEARATEVRGCTAS